MSSPRLLVLGALLQGTPYAPPIQPASEEGRQAMASFVVPEDVSLSLFAAEPLLAQPVCFDVAADGERVFVAETFRHHKGVTDIRDHMDWLDDDLACRTVEDRVAMFAKHLGERFEEYRQHHERVRVVLDRDRDGKADDARVFADGFKDAADGIGAGLLALGDKLYYTCIPSLWSLEDADRDGVSDRRKALSTGYGVRVALLGHDLHGLIVGPDGKLYFSCGDRGFNVVTRSGPLDHSRTGAVLRCELDGSALEVFATGLRNPQELAFDDFGELFTGDNNSDGGDQARFVHVVEGGDSGWRQAYQWISEPNLRGPWNAEEIWQPRRAVHPAYILPPIANVANGPSGLCYQPGTALGERYADTFFLCDFRGEASSSGIHALRLERAGASFRLVSDEWFLRGSLVTDCGFGPDGALWFSDWVFGWNQNGKGRLYRAVSKSPETAGQLQTKELLRDGLGAPSADRLQDLLNHADRRVRLAAQFELARRGDEGRARFERVLGVPVESGLALERLHAVWGLAQLARARGEAPAPALVAALGDGVPVLRAQAAKALGDLAFAPARTALENLLSDPDDRVALQAAIALGKLTDRASFAPLIAFLASRAGDDPVLRHAGVMGLIGCADDAALRAVTSDERDDVRLAAVLALRRLGSASLTAFFADAKPRVAREAIGAAYDEEIQGSLFALAALAGDADRFVRIGPHAARRVLAACLRLGREQDARSLAQLAAHPDVPMALRVEAVSHLAAWFDPPRRDPVTGEWRPMPSEWREASHMPALLEGLAGDLSLVALDPACGAVGVAWLRWVEQARLEIDPALLLRLAAGEEHNLDVRVAALECLSARGAELQPSHELVAFAREACAHKQERLRAAALDLLMSIAPEEALDLARTALEAGSPAEMRAALGSLVRLDSNEADLELSAALQRLQREALPAEVALDVVEALEARGKQPGAPSEWPAALAARRQSFEAKGLSSAFHDSLFGGDAARGRKLFREKAELTCLRCHAVEPSAASSVGPNLSDVGARLDRAALLEAIVEPNRTKAEGWMETMFVLSDDSAVAGRVLERDNQRVKLVKSDGAIVELELGEIANERIGLSAMPEGLDKHLSAREMRDLIEYLSSLKP